MKRDISTDAWKYYELGRSYNMSLRPDLYSMVETNTEFYNGNQWIRLPDNDAMRRLPKPVFNIIKRVLSLFVASLTASGTAVTLDSLSDVLADTDEEAVEICNAELRSLFEKFKMDYRIRDLLTDGAISGDYCLHFYYDPSAKPYNGAFGACLGEIEMEMLDGINVMFGNPNIRDVERQPYILITGRDTVENLKAEAVRWRKITQGVSKTGAGTEPVSDPEDVSITPDHGGVNGYWTGTAPELHGDDDKSTKAQYVYLYTKKRKSVSVPDGDGKTHLETVESVHVTKATRTAVIFEDVDTGLSRYPVAWGNWQRQKNCYHGRALVTEVIPNQILINQMIAMVFRHLQTAAFPTKVYNADLIPSVSNEVGTAIGVRNLMPGQSIGSVMSTVPAADMSNQIIQCINLCMDYTKECLGATESQLGNADPTNTSALMVLKSSSDVPLENIRSNLYEFTEDVAAILLDMIGTYYGDRPVLREETVRVPVLGADGRQLPDPVTGEPATIPSTRKVLKNYNFRKLKKMFFNIRVDVGPTSYFSEIAAAQTLDNLRREGIVDVVDYLERLPDGMIPRKEELIDKLKNGTAALSSFGAGNGNSGELTGSGMPPDLTVPLEQLSKKARKVLG